MRILLTLAFLIAFSASAYADTITVINEDGTKSSIEIGPSPFDPPSEQSAAPENKPANLRLRPPVADPAPAPAPAAKPAKKPAQKKQAVKKETPAKKEAAPKKKKEAPVKKAVPPKKKKAPTPAQRKTQKKQAPPAAPDHASTPPSAAPPSQRLGVQMTPDDAIRLALDVAPPSRSVHAYPINYKGLHAYQVVFETEDGDRSVFIDRETAKFIK